MELHVYQGYPLFLQEAIDRWHSYPPPCYGYYVIPWLWYDGNQHGGNNPSTWDDSIISRLNRPAPVSITTWGYYSPGSGNGTIFARFRNDSTAAITASVIFVITEDSIYYAAPNSDSMHNHVVRDYLPDHIGTGVVIAPGDSVLVTRPFTISSGWDPGNCVLVTILQDTAMLSDSTRNVFQCAKTRISDLGIADNYNNEVKEQNMISARPNPSSRHVSFTLTGMSGSAYALLIYDAAGRLTRDIMGIMPHSAYSWVWDLKDKNGRAAGPGVYFYEYKNGSRSRHGKIVIGKGAE